MLRFWVSSVYSIAVLQVTENARQHIRVLFGERHARPIVGVRRERDRHALSVPHYPFELVKCNIIFRLLLRSIGRNLDRKDERGSFPRVRWASLA